jgi:hypothetical protein
VSAPPQCCIAGADGQPWPCRSAWLVAFRSSSVSPARSRCRDLLLDAWSGHACAAAPSSQKRKHGPGTAEQCVRC